MSLYGLIKRPGPSGFGYNSTAEQVTEGLDLSGKTYLITGCNSGIGAEAFRVLALRGATALGAARSLAKAEAACAQVQGDALPIACELSEPSAVRAAVEAVKATGRQLDGILCNAGVMGIPKRTLRHGVELQLLTNHIGHFILVTGLLEQLSPAGRVVMLSSAVHTRTWPEGVRVDDFASERGYDGWIAYGQSKLCNLLFAKELSRRLPQGQTANALHPGVIASNIGRNMPGAVNALFKALGPIFATKTAAQGAATQVFVLTHPSLEGVTGEYFADCNVAQAGPQGQDMALAEALWAATEAAVARL